MGYSVRVVCRPELAQGFELAGVPTDRARTQNEGVARVMELAEESDLGVVLIEDAFYDGLTDSEKRVIERRPNPMFVPFPGPRRAEESERAEAYVVEILRRAIGYTVRLR